MNATPLLQIAMDYISLPKALAMAVQVAPEVDIIEIGTPLCKAAGLEAIRSMREICPDKIILADLKTPDVGELEATMAFDAGADMMTVIGGAALATVEQALGVARKRGKEMLMELTGVRDIIARATEWRRIGVDRIVYHREWDAQSAGREWAEEDKDIIRELIEMGYKVTVTGGITMELLPFFADLPVSVLICGRGIREAANPRAAAHEMRLALAELWSGASPSTRKTSSSAGSAASSIADLSVKAIRWGVSEMGLSLDMDGRECPGCDSPRRFCLNSQTNIQCPGSLRSADIVRSLGQSVSANGAFGEVSENAFFLDPTQLGDLSRNRVIDLLNATGTALRKLGHPVDTNAGIRAANQVFGIS
ncbi:MAG: orotidine 5'-phosphate decarboxylase / HUMPS family protein [Anaerolineales bacterium]|jgi:3-dehydro-L-gulonate-6-phosphate decarboxylase